MTGVLIYQIFIMNYQHVKKIIPLIGKRANNDLRTNSVEVSNSSNSQIIQDDTTVCSFQDEKLLSVLQDSQQSQSSETNCSSKCIGWYFYSDAAFDLSSTVFTDTRISILENGLGNGKL